MLDRLRDRIARESPLTPTLPAAFAGKRAVFYLEPDLFTNMELIPADIRCECAYFEHLLHWQYAMGRADNCGRVRLAQRRLREVIPSPSSNGSSRPWCGTTCCRPAR